MRSFSSVVSDICVIHLNDPGLAHRARASRALANVIAEMELAMPTPVRSDFFTISGSYTIQMPERCTAVTKAGILCGDRYKLFGRSEKVFRHEPDSQCACVDAGISSCDACTFHNVWVNNHFGEAYGYKKDPWANGEFRFDKFLGEIQFSSGTDVFEGQRVLVEYITTGDTAALNQIPDSLVNMLAFRVASILNIGSDNTAAQMQNREFGRSYDAAVRAWNALPPEELIASLMGQNMSAPKI